MYIVYEHGCTFAMVCMWKSEENLQKLILSYCIGSGDQAQVVRTDNGCLYPLNHLAGPDAFAVKSLESALDQPNHCFFTKSQAMKIVTCSKGALCYGPSVDAVP